MLFAAYPEYQHKILQKLQAKCVEEVSRIINLWIRMNTMRKDKKILYFTVVYQSMVEHSAVNRVVVGSSPTRGAAQ